MSTIFNQFTVKLIQHRNIIRSFFFLIMVIHKYYAIRIPENSTTSPADGTPLPSLECIWSKNLLLWLLFHFWSVLMDTYFIIGLNRSLGLLLNIQVLLNNRFKMFARFCVWPFVIKRGIHIADSFLIHKCAFNILDIFTRWSSNTILSTLFPVVTSFVLVQIQRTVLCDRTEPLWYFFQLSFRFFNGFFSTQVILISTQFAKLLET